MAACSSQNQHFGTLIGQNVFSNTNQIGYFMHKNVRIFSEDQKKSQKVIVVTYSGKRNRRVCCVSPPHDAHCVNGAQENNNRKENVFFLDANSLCYIGSSRNLSSFARWISIFFRKITHKNPVIAVLDGREGNEYRRQLLPSYKVDRRTPKFKILPGSENEHRGTNELIYNVLRSCNVPVVEIEDREADDVVATLVQQVVEKGHMVTIASQDKDFRQLLSANVQMVIPDFRLEKWSFYTVKQYFSSHQCDPVISDISLRCLIGDEVDGVPGVHQIIPAFGRKTAIKLLRKHGTLQNLLSAAAVRVVARPYIQNALKLHADLLRKNYEVLLLRSDVDVHFEDEWLSERNSSNDSAVLSELVRLCEETPKECPTFTFRFSNRR